MCKKLEESAQFGASTQVDAAGSALAAGRQNTPAAHVSATPARGDLDVLLYLTDVAGWDMWRDSHDERAIAAWEAEGGR
jgi:hypothetical protein